MSTSRTRAPHRGQQEFDLATEQQPRIDFELRPRMSLSRTLTPESWGVASADYADISDAMTQAADPERIRYDLASCYPVANSSAGRVSYVDQRSGNLIYVALSPAEFTMLPRNVRALGQASLLRTQAARPVSNQSYDAAQRSVAHTYRSKQDKIKDYADNVLDPRAILLNKFKKAALHPGLSQFGDEVSMRQALTEYRSILDDTVYALGSVRDYSPPALDLARRSIEWRLLYDYKYNRHIAYFASLTSVLIGHNAVKLALFRDRENALEKVSGNNER